MSEAVLQPWVSGQLTHPRIHLLSLWYNPRRRGARVAEWGGLENRCGSLGHRGFESHPLR